MTDPSPRHRHRCTARGALPGALRKLDPRALVAAPGASSSSRSGAVVTHRA